MYLRKQEAQELQGETEQPAEISRRLQKSSGGTACQGSLQQKLIQVLFEAPNWVLDISSEKLP